MAAAAFLRNCLLSAMASNRAGLASLGLRVGGLGTSFLLGVVLARSLGPAAFGQYGLVITLAVLAMTLALLGTPQIAVREFAALAGGQHSGAIAGLSKRLIKATTLASVGLAAFAVVAAVVIDQTSLDIVLPGALSIPFLTLTALAAAQMRGLGAMSLGQVMDILARPLAALILFAAILAIGWPASAPLALWVQFGVAVVAAVVSLSWLSRHLPQPAADARSIPWLAAALPMCLIDLLRQFDGAYGMIILGWLSNDVDLGLYRAAISCSVVVAMPVTILHVVHAPQVARLYRDGDTAGLQSLLSRVSLTATVLVGLITLGCLVLGLPLIRLFFGTVYAGSWAPLTILCVAQLVFALFGMGPILLAMCNRERALTRIYIVAIIAAVATAVALADRLGGAGIAIAQIVSFAIVGGLSWRDGRRHLGVDCSIFGRLLDTPRAPELG